MTLEYCFTNAGIIEHSSGSLVSGGVFTITTPADLKTSIDGKWVFFGQLAFTFAGGNATGCDPGTVTGGGTISPTAGNVGNVVGKILREGDTGTLTGGGTLGGTPVTVTGGVVLGDPGQDTVRAE